MNQLEAIIHPIAHIETPFHSKFGVPRQSGIITSVESLIVFEPEYRIAEAVRGIEEFDYLWLIWQFSEAVRNDWSPTVRPPRLGGNQRVGVFATRSPFRPNNLGLSSVQLTKIEQTSRGMVLHVLGADLMNGTPIFDIKPYLPYTDSHPQARSGFAPTAANHLLEVVWNDSARQMLAAELIETITDVLAHDPRPQYQHDPERVYGFCFADYEIRFKVDDGNKLEVLRVDPIGQ